MVYFSDFVKTVQTSDLEVVVDISVNTSNMRLSASV